MFYLRSSALGGIIFSPELQFCETKEILFKNLEIKWKDSLIKIKGFKKIKIIIIIGGRRR